MADLSLTAASNSPAGTDVIGTSHDDYLRAYQAILRSTNAKGGDIASATTCDIGAATAEFIDITGTTTITALGTIAAGIVRTCRFTGTLTLTHNATSLILPGAANIVTAVGDVAMFRSLGSGNWVCVGYLRANGQAAGDGLVKGRLTLVTASAVPATDQAAKTTVYYTPYLGAPFTELSLALDNDAGHTGYQQSGKNFDLFLYNDAGTLRLGTGPAWATDSTRGAGAGTTQLGITGSFLGGQWTNAVSMLLRFGASSGNTVTCAATTAFYVGTLRASADGVTDDSLSKRFLWNMYNRLPRAMRVLEASDTWTYSTTAWRQTNNNNANLLQFVRGLDEDAVQASASATVSNSGATARVVRNGIGLDSSTAFAADCLPDVTSITSNTSHLWAHYRGMPGLGYHYLCPLEFGAGADTQTWLGDGGAATIAQTGIIGVTMA